MTERQWAIYTLSDPRTPDVVRYVGVTHDKPSNRLAIRGKTHTAASRANMSAGSKGKPWTATETAAHAPVRSDPEWRARVSQSNKETYARRKAAGQVGTRKGQEVSEETRERLRLAHLGKTQSEETKAKRSASLRAAWARKKAEGVA